MSMDPHAKKVTSISDHFRTFGKMGNTIESFDWSQSSLGIIDSWPGCLITNVGMILTSPQPCGILWGSDYVFIYNEAYHYLLGLSHTKALGQPYFEHGDGSTIVTKEMLADVMERNNRGGTKCCEDKLFVQEKEHGVFEETYFTLYVSPIYNESCAIGGYLINGIETTKLVLTLRRSTILRELSLANEKTIYGCCQAISKVFDASSVDIPFSLVYLCERNNNNKVVLQSFTGIVAGTQASPLEIPIGLDANPTTCWPLYVALNSGASLLVDDLKLKFGEDWWPNTDQALVAPINGVLGPQGVLVIGISPLARFDDDYRLFTKQLVSEVNNVLWKAGFLEGNAVKTQEIADASHEKTVFFTNVVHEFRTPLSLMLGPLADLLASDTNNALNSIQREKLSMIQRNSIRLVKLVNSIMDFSRIEAGRLKMNYQPTDLSKLTREIGSLFEVAMTMAGLEFLINIEPIDQPAYVDPEMWEKIITNLISNAFKFTFQGKVELILRRNSNNVVLQVVDTGVGIPETDFKSIFNRFHQVDTIKGRSSDGSGIGLFLVYELVKLHDGIISVKSKVKCGTAFTVTIPMATKNYDTQAKIRTNFEPTAYCQGMVEEAMGWSPEFTVEHHLSTKEVQTPDDIDAPYSLPSKNSTILLAEDNADMRDYIRGSLIKLWNVDVTSNGLEAYELACANEFDLIISDVMMPKLDGLSLIQMLRRNPKTRGIPIILLTVRTAQEALVKGFEFGADDYLVKTSFSKEELIARSRKHIELGRFRRFLELQVEEKEGELHKLDKAYYEFIDMVCHEIRNPLHGISGNWELLMERFESLEQAWKPSAENKNMSEIQQTLFTYLAEMKSYLTNIEVCTAHQTRVIDEVVLRAKLQRNKYEVAYSRCDLADLLKESIDRFDKIAKNLGLDINVTHSSHQVEIDVNCVKQILGNLIGTMIRNMEKGGVVTIDSLKEETSLRFEIKCTNIKPNIFIDEEAQSSAMQFAQSEGEHYNNVSFGVSLCNKLIALIGGERITIARSEQNDICLVFVILCKPASQETSPTNLNDNSDKGLDDDNYVMKAGNKEKPVEVERSHKLPNIRVPTKRALVAEDNIINQTLCKALLAKQGYTCTIARNGKEALEKFVPDAYDFILMDITMPELNGFEVTKRIRAIEAAMDVDYPVSIIGLSAYSQQEKIDAAVEAGMDDFISKPATFAKIVNIIEHSLVKSDRKKSKADLFEQNSGVDRAAL